MILKNKKIILMLLTFKELKIICNILEIRSKLLKIICNILEICSKLFVWVSIIFQSSIIFRPRQLLEIKIENQ